jgi:hypothetical protein
VDIDQKKGKENKDKGAYLVSRNVDFGLFDVLLRNWFDK